MKINVHLFPTTQTTDDVIMTESPRESKHANTIAYEGLVRDVVGNRIKESVSDYLDGRCRRRAANDFSVQSCLLVT